MTSSSDYASGLAVMLTISLISLRHCPGKSMQLRIFVISLSLRNLRIFSTLETQLVGRQESQATNFRSL